MAMVVLRVGRLAHDCEQTSLGGAMWAVGAHGVGAVVKCDCGRLWTLKRDPADGFRWRRRFLPVLHRRNGQGTGA